MVSEKKVQDTVAGTHTGNEMQIDLLNLEEGFSIMFESTVYIVVKVLGSGAFGKVAMCRKEGTDEIVALKFIKSNNLNQVIKEAVALRYVQDCDRQHNTLIKFFDCFQYKDYYCLVFEVLDCSLTDIIKERRRNPLNATEIRIIAKQMLSALSTLKRLSLTHTDIKPDNIMLADRNSQQLQYKLIDFGLSTFTLELSEYRLIQNRAYRAPEVFLGLPRDEAVDMWGLGCTLACMFLGRHLFPVKNDYDTLKTIVKLLGMPEKDALDKGSQVPFYFKQKKTGSETTWKLKTQQEFELSIGITVQKGPRIYYVLESLDDFLVPEIEDPDEIKDTKAFVDLLKKMLTINPADRILPDAALHHSFITMEHLADCESPYVREAYSIMSESQLTDEDCVSPVHDSKDIVEEQRSATTVQQPELVNNVTAGDPDDLNLMIIDPPGQKESPPSSSNNSNNKAGSFHVKDGIIVNPNPVDPVANGNFNKEAGNEREEIYSKEGLKHLPTGTEGKPKKKKFKRVRKFFARVFRTNAQAFH